MLLSLNGFLQYLMCNCLDINTSTKREAVTLHPDVIRAAIFVHELQKLDVSIALREGCFLSTGY